MSTTMSDQTIKCPDWCQSKPHDDPDGGFDGPHTWPAIPALDGFNDDKDDNYNSSVLISVDLPEPGSDDKRTLIYLTAGNLTMTPDQAMDAATALGMVASWAGRQAATT